jgi:hypothetical protein
MARTSSPWSSRRTNADRIPGAGKSVELYVDRETGQVFKELGGQ